MCECVCVCENVNVCCVTTLKIFELFLAYLAYLRFWGLEEKFFFNRTEKMFRKVLGTE